MTQGYENLRGENCNMQNPEIAIRFKQPNLAYISKIEIQRENEKTPGNVRQIEATFYDANNSLILDDITDDPVKWRSPDNEPTIWGYFRNIRGLNLKVLRTDNNDTVRRLRVKITGCYREGKTHTGDSFCSFKETCNNIRELASFSLFQ